MPREYIVTGKTITSRFGRTCIFMLLLLLQGCDRKDAASEDLAGPAKPELATGLSTVPGGYADVLVAGGIANPTQMEIAPDGRIFVSEQGGRLRVIKNGVLLPTPFLRVSVSTTGERGLLGLAFDPNFAAERYVYIMYTSPVGPRNKVSRFTVSASNPDVADPGSETVLLELPLGLCDCGWHNGGGVHFGTDGKLYLAVGESTVGSRAQELTTTMGKMLRINKDGTIPTDNPYYGQTSGSNRSIYAIGFRNPYTFAVQPGTGRIFVNDVGQGLYEEIDDLLPGRNYGWPAGDGPLSNPAYVNPFFGYYHDQGCAISGGAFYNPATAQFPADFVGDYFYSDYCGNWIRKLDVATKTTTSFVTGANQPTDVKVGNDGSLYYVARGAGEVRRVYSTSSQVPIIGSHPASLTVPVGASATFSVSASGPGPLSYQWQRNGANISGAAGQSYTLSPASLGDNGARFRCRVSNAAGSATSNEAILTVTTNQRPTADITLPLAGARFSGGMTIQAAGGATDPEEGALPASRLTWEVRLFHDDGNPHSHSFIAPISGITGGSFVIPAQSETSPNIWYRIYLTAADAAGLTHTDSTDILPNKVSITLASNPPGLTLNLDGAAVTTPYTFTAVVGIQRNLGAVTPQTFGGTSYNFVSWSDGQGATHDIFTPSSNTTYTATYQGGAGARVIEAENAVFSGPLRTTKHPGHTGSGYLDFQNDNGDWVEWSFSLAAQTQVVLPIRYATASSVQVRVTLNGSVIFPNFSMPATGGWGTWSTVNLSGPLAAGAYTIRLTTIGVGQPNIDNLGLP